MDIRSKAEAIVKRILPEAAYCRLKKHLHVPTKGRKEANNWLQVHCRNITGRVLSIGSGDDADGQGKHYRDYFVSANAYTTSDMFEAPAIDLVIDARHMPEIESASYDGILCVGVLEHIDDFQSAFNEITRILKPDGTLILTVPFRYPPHMEPYDFWRFTAHGIRYLLKDRYTINDLLSNDNTVDNFPAAYLVDATLKSHPNGKNEAPFTQVS